MRLKLSFLCIEKNIVKICFSPFTFKLLYDYIYSCFWAIIYAKKTIVTIITSEGDDYIES